MSAVSPPPGAPDFTLRLGVILAGLAALVVRAFLRHPRNTSLARPAWRLITLSARRLQRAFARPSAAAPATPHRKSPRLRTAPRPRFFPAGHAWLVAAIGAEAAAYASQLAALLAEPEAAAAFADSPAARRTLRPIRRMLGLDPAGRLRAPAAPRRQRRPQRSAPKRQRSVTPPLWLREAPPEHARTRWPIPPPRRNSG